ncbi:MAG: Ig-like domain-containing protein [Bdellovibrionaceae bacterium]|nr:Ig-like domain-containing protein [Pseudobdellovibrionaceae bacterium]
MIQGFSKYRKFFLTTILCHGLFALQPAIAAITAQLSAPVSNTTITTGSFILSANVTSSTAVSSVIFYRDNWTQVGVSSTPPFQISLSANTISAGSHTFFAVARDISGTAAATSISSVNIVLPVVAPVASISAVGSPVVTAALGSPVVTAALSGANVLLSASLTSSDSTIEVTFYRDSWILLAATKVSLYQISIAQSSLSSGTHTFFAVARNAAGGAQASAITSLNIPSSQVAAPAPAPDRAPAAAPAPAPSTVSSCQPGAVVGWDPMPLFKKSYISGGPYAGAYTVGPAGYLNWYFSSLGVLGFIDRLPSSEVKQYLNSYMASLDKPTATSPGYTIQDVTFANPASPATSASSKKPQDSDDSYASTILSVASRYVACNDADGRAWLSSISTFGSGETNLQVLKKIAAKNLTDTTKDSPTGLIHTFQDLNKYPIYYTEDNTEVYKGLNDFTKLLSRVGDADAGFYGQAASTVAAGIQTYLFMNNQAVSNLSNGVRLNVSGFGVAWQNGISDNFYPGAVTQLFPVALGVPMPDATNKTALATLNAMAPSWCNRLYDTNGRDPFMILGYGAALLGDQASAQCQLDFFAQQAQAGTATITVTGLGYYQRTVNLLRGQAPY